ncbi:MAG: DUF1501 domain-containing protein [Planctomycetota bacterium]
MSLQSTLRQLSIRRRHWLAGSGIGISMPLIRTRSARSADVQANTSTGFGRARSVIVVFASGGQSQLDMWDPKPEAPKEVRGAFSAIPTAVSGVRFCEYMPQIARIADRLTVVRSMTHEDLDHGSAFYLAMTGRYHRQKSANPLPSSEDQPCFGSVIQRVRPNVTFPQTAIHLNGPAEVPLIIGAGQFGGLLGKGYDPLTLGDVTQDPVAIPSLLAHADVSSSRLESRQQLLQALERRMDTVSGQQSGDDKSSLYHQAFSMLDRPVVRDAFDLAKEPDALRDRYGRGRAGQACLLARRLAQAGVPLINVFWSHNNRGQDVDPTNDDLYGWDTHNDIFDSLKNHLLPRFDQGFSALIEDLETQGMLEETLVVCMGEFGRAPMVAVEKNFAGSSPGRKHWSWVYSIVMAGAGINRGCVVGASDRRGAYPHSESFGPWDVSATIFHALGIDPSQHYFDPFHRPIRISDGRVMTSLYQ